MRRKAPSDARSLFCNGPFDGFGRFRGQQTWPELGPELMEPASESVRRSDDDLRINSARSAFRLPLRVLFQPIPLFQRSFYFLWSWTARTFYLYGYYLAVSMLSAGLGDGYGFYITLHE